MQIALRELTDSLNPAARKIFRDLRFTGREDTTEASCAIRTYLGVQLDEQTSWSTVEVGWRRWRQVVEDVGVFVFKRSLRQRNVSGFCISDAEFPVICVNNSASVTRQVFTLFHELSHVLMQTNGITLRDDRYIEHLPHQAKRAEVFCNALAAETLVPSGDFARFIVAGPWSDEAIGSVADRYKVSREVILRRLADAGQVSTNEYVRRREVWLDQSGRREGAGGGNYYATKASYLGTTFLRLAFGKYYQGRCSLEQLADYLNMKPEHVPRLEQYLVERGSTS
jgi:Zn-dependent peptidase ImmA (M78 family)